MGSGNALCRVQAGTDSCVAHTGHRAPRLFGRNIIQVGLTPGCVGPDQSLAPSLRTRMRVVVGDEGRVLWLVPPGAISAGEVFRVRAGRAVVEVTLPAALDSRVDLGELELR